MFKLREVARQHHGLGVTTEGLHGEVPWRRRHRRRHRRCAHSLNPHVLHPSAGLATVSKERYRSGPIATPGVHPQGVARVGVQRTSTKENRHREVLPVPQNGASHKGDHIGDFTQLAPPLKWVLCCWHRDLQHQLVLSLPDGLQVVKTRQGVPSGAGFA